MVGKPGKKPSSPSKRSSIATLVGTLGETLGLTELTVRDDGQLWGSGSGVSQLRDGVFSSIEIPRVLMPVTVSRREEITISGIETIEAEGADWDAPPAAMRYWVGDVVEEVTPIPRFGVAWVALDSTGRAGAYCASEDLELVRIQIVRPGGPRAAIELATSSNRVAAAFDAAGRLVVADGQALVRYDATGRPVARLDAKL